MMKDRLQNDVITSDKKVKSRNLEKYFFIADNSGNTMNIIA